MPNWQQIQGQRDKQSEFIRKGVSMCRFNLAAESRKRGFSIWHTLGFDLLQRAASARWSVEWRSSNESRICPRTDRPIPTYTKGQMLSKPVPIIRVRRAH